MAKKGKFAVRTDSINVGIICEEFGYLWLKLNKEDWQENYIKNRINKGCNNSNVVLCNRQISRKNKLQIYKI